MFTIIIGLKAPAFAVVIVNAALVPQLHEQVQHVLAHNAVLLTIFDGVFDNGQHGQSNRILEANAKQKLGDTATIRLSNHLYPN